MSEWLRSRFEQRGVVYLGALFCFIRFRQKFLMGKLFRYLAVHFGLWAVVCAVKRRSALLITAALLWIAVERDSVVAFS